MRLRSLRRSTWRAGSGRPESGGYHRAAHRAGAKTRCTRATCSTRPRSNSSQKSTIRPGGDSATLDAAGDEAAGAVPSPSPARRALRHMPGRLYATARGHFNRDRLRSCSRAAQGGRIDRGHRAAERGDVQCRSSKRPPTPTRAPKPTDARKHAIDCAARVPADAALLHRHPRARRDRGRRLRRRHSRPFREDSRRAAIIRCRDFRRNLGAPPPHEAPSLSPGHHRNLRPR